MYTKKKERETKQSKLQKSRQRSYIERGKMVRDQCVGGDDVTRYERHCAAMLLASVPERATWARMCS